MSPRAEPNERLPAPPRAERILVIRLGALGDVVRTRFAFAGLRELYPSARIEWLVDDRCAAGLVALPGLDETIELPRRRLRASRPLRALIEARTVVRELRRRNFDLSVDFHGSLRGASLAASARIPVRVGYAQPFAKDFAERLLTHRARVRPLHISRFERNAALLRFLGGEIPSAPRVLDPSVLVRPPQLPARFAVIHPGTSPKTDYKRWEPERFGAVARALHERAEIATLVAYGPSPRERQAAEQVVAASNGTAALAPETHALVELIAILGAAQVFVGCDSGPMHLASLAGTPVVGIFGPTDPIENAPYAGGPQRSVRVDVGCNPCREGCPARACMRAIEPDQVVAAALSLLGTGRSASLPGGGERGI